MFRKSLLKAALSEQVEVNTVKDYDIIKLYQKHHKEGSERQRRILEIQRRAVRNGIDPPKRKRETPQRVADKTFLPQIVTNVGHTAPLDNSPRVNDGNGGNEGEDSHDTKTHHLHLPELRVKKSKKERSIRSDSHGKAGNEGKDGNNSKTQAVAKDRFGFGKAGNEGRDGNDSKTQNLWNSNGGYGETGNDMSKDVTETKTHNVQLPRIAADKRKANDNRGVDRQRQPVYDQRFRSLLSSLIDLPRQFGQIQCYAPSTRLSYATPQKQK